MKKITIEWERIGRSQDVAPFTATFDPDDDESVDALSEMIDRFIGRHLSSRNYDWSLDLHGDGRIWIEGSRFGGGIVTFQDVP